MTSPVEIQDPADAQLVRETLRVVLSAPEYRRLVRPNPEPPEARPLPDWLDRILDWLVGRRDRKEKAAWSLPALAALALRVLVYALVAAAFAVVAFLIVRRLGLGRRTREPVTPVRAETGPLPQAPGESPPEEYAARAVARARAGDFREGIRLILLAAMSAIERHGWIRFRRGLTNRDYLRAVAARTRQREPLSSMIAIFEQVHYGRRAATAEWFRQCLAGYRKGFLTR